MPLYHKGLKACKVHDVLSVHSPYSTANYHCNAHLNSRVFHQQRACIKFHLQILPTNSTTCCYFPSFHKLYLLVSDAQQWYHYD